MKKFSTLLLAAAASLLAVSCAKELTQEVTPEQAAPEVAASLGAATRASVATAEDGTRTIVWDKGDSISVFYRNEMNQKYLLKSGEGTTHGNFKCASPFAFNFSAGCPYVFCVYPYNKYNEMYQGQLGVEIPAKQAFVADGFDPKANVMVGAADPGEDIAFKNVGSYLLLQLYGANAKVKSITVTSGAGEYLAGPAVVDLVPGEDPVIGKPKYEYENVKPIVRSSTVYVEKVPYYYTSGSKRVTLTCKDSVAVGATAADATTFWMVVIPQELEEGFTVRVKWTGGTMTKKLTSKIALERSTVCRMEAFELVPSEAAEGDFVEMGPDGLQWATCNLGADEPEDDGDYFAWGEIAPKDEYTWMTYKYHTHESDNYYYVTKYTFADDQYGSIWYDSNYNFIGDNKTELEAADDAATQILGGDYRIPTADEWDWLLRNCTWEPVLSDDEEDLLGYNVTSDNTGNSIFLPAAGYFEDDDLDDYLEEGYYWSSSLSTPGSLKNSWGFYPYADYACYVWFEDDEDEQYNGLYSSSRKYGFPIRPVKGAKTMLR